MPVPADVMPETVSVPVQVSLRLSPLGRLPFVTLMQGVGKPDDVTL